MRRQNTLHCGPRESAIAHRALQRTHQIFAAIHSQQTQHARGFVLAVTPGAQQFVEEANSLGSELGKPLLEQLAFLQMIASGGMRGQTALLCGDSQGIQLMSGNLLHVRAVNNEILLCDSDRQQLADALPGHGIEVLQIGDVAVRIDSAIENLRRIVRLGGQTEQMRPLFLE